MTYGRGSIIILRETTTIRKGMLHDRLKEINLSNLAYIYSNSTQERYT